MRDADLNFNVNVNKGGKHDFGDQFKSPIFPTEEEMVNK